MAPRRFAALRSLPAAALLLATLFAGALSPIAADETPSPASTADRLILKDGRTLEGRIEGEDDESFALRAGGSLRLIRKEDVAETHRAPVADPPAPPANEGDSETEARKKVEKPGKGDASDRKRERKPAEGTDAPPRTPEAMSPELARWVSGCVSALGSGDPSVVRSAAQALGVVGPPALPSIRAARQGADPFLLRILEGVEESIKAGSSDAAPVDGADRRIRGIVDRARRDLALNDAGAKALAGSLGRFSREFMETLADVRDGLLAPAEAIGAVEVLRARLRKDLEPSLTVEQIRGVDTILDELARRLRNRAEGGDRPPPGKAPDGAKPGGNAGGEGTAPPPPPDAKPPR
jgi:hypothetical protein